MNRRNSISPYYVYALMQGAIYQGYDVTSIVSNCGIDIDLVNSKAGFSNNRRVEIEKVSALIREVWKLLDDEFMGFTDHACKKGVFAIIAKQIIGEENLGEALKRACYLYSTLRNDISFRLEYVSEGVQLSFNTLKPELDSAHFLVEFFLLIWHRFSSWLVAERLPLKHVLLSYPRPEHVEEYSLLFPCHCTFNSNENALVFDKKLMSLNIKQGIKELEQFLLNSPTDLLSKPDFQISFSTQVMNAIQDRSANFRSLEQVSSQFNMSARNLRRRLAEENTSYAEIKQQLRLEKAITQLVENKMSISEIGQNLGFVEVAAFSRAFKSWTGESPRHYRDKHVR